MRILLFSLLFISCTTHLEEVILIDNPASESGKFPRLFTDNTGLIYMSWMETIEDSTILYYSTLDGQKWSETKHISGSKSWFVNWADFPSIIGRDGKLMAAHWLQKKPGGTYSYDVSIASDMYNFQNTITPHTDNTPTEHGFVSMIPVSDSTFYAVWLDGRNTTGGHLHESEHVADLSTAMTLRGAMIQNSEILSDEEIDPSLCDCCNTSLVKTDDGLIVAYRDRTENEVRDIYTSTFDIDSQSWSTPISVSDDNWEIAACPVNGPMLDYKNNEVVVAWFTGANNQPFVKTAFSFDNGKSWESELVIEQTAQTLGRVDAIANGDGSAWISWLRRTDNSGEIVIRKVTTEGSTLSEFVFNNVDVSRSSGFPQITHTKESGLLVAWTDITNIDNPIIKTSIIQ